MDPVERLAGIEEIKALKARYFRGVDTRDWDLLREVFTEDVVLDFRGATTETGAEEGEPLLREEDEVMRGREAALAGLELGLTGVESVHQGYLPEIELREDGTAEGVWAMSDRLITGDGAPFRELRGYGYYHETYRRERGRWRIATCRLTRLRVELDA